MPAIEKAVDAIVRTRSWDARIALIRKVPEDFGISQHRDVYSTIAQKVYVPNLAPDFAYVHWREDYGLDQLRSAYGDAVRLTKGFREVDSVSLARTVKAKPATIRVFRLPLGFTPQEFAAATNVLPKDLHLKPVSGSKIKGWETVRKYATEGVPLAVFLRQRHYEGAFRQLLDATSTTRGDILEEAVEVIFEHNKISFVRTGSKNQAEIARRFGITVKPAPDFVVFDKSDTLRAILECKGANDGGTARDKAARFRSLRTEAGRLGGIPLFAVLAGLGWKRSADALGPVVRDPDERVFTPPTLSDMISTQPFPTLRGKRPS